MIGTAAWPSSSSWWRITPTRPSIMSLGATASAPASAWEIAVFASSSRVMSLSTSPSRTKPQCPCEVYSQRQTSVNTSRSGVLLLQGPDRELHDPLGVVGPGADLVLVGGDAEQQHRADPGIGDLRRLLHQLGDREPLDPRHRRHRLADPLPGDDEERLDQLRGREVGLADQIAQRGLGAEPAKAGRGKGHGSDSRVRRSVKRRSESRAISP